MAFDAAAYLAANRDVAEAGIDPLTHWQLYGQAEGRSLGTDLPMSASNPGVVNFTPGGGGLSNDLWALLGGAPGANPTQPTYMGGTNQATEAPGVLEHRPTPTPTPTPPRAQVTPQSPPTGSGASQGSMFDQARGMMPYVPSGVDYGDKYWNTVGDYYQSMFGTQTGLNASNLIDWYKNQGWTPGQSMTQQSSTPSNSVVQGLFGKELGSGGQGGIGTSTGSTMGVGKMTDAINEQAKATFNKFVKIGIAPAVAVTLVERVMAEKGLMDAVNQAEDPIGVLNAIQGWTDVDPTYNPWSGTPPTNYDPHAWKGSNNSGGGASWSGTNQSAANTNSPDFGRGINGGWNA